MKFLFKNTKIISTFGPSVSPKFNCKEDLDDPVALAIRSRSSQIIRDLFFNGVNCVRFNFSHGFYEENDSRIFLINGVQKGILEDQSGFDYRFLRPVVFMADTKGPEIRVFDMTPNGVSYKIGQIITINCTDRVVGSEDGFSVFDSTETYNMANDCVVGNMILVEDGKLTLEILEVDKLAGKVKVKVKNNCLLKTNKRINLPGADYSMDFLSNKDIEDIKYAIDKGFEYVALSFVNSKKDVESVRSLIKDYCEERGLTSFLKVYSKIETMKSCENIDEIIESSDGIMIARGDLGLEIPYYVVPF